MSNTQTTNSTYPFLQGGGEMGEMTRQYDWSATPIGTPDEWPQSLRTILSVILRSKFPMLIFWGKELTQFYNDAFRPSFGNNGKHPLALGQRGEDCWQEIWPVIKPLLDQVLAGGEAIWSENQLVPFYRNGQLEDIYWTFCYSAIIDESGDIAGVLVTCTETTQTVEQFKIWEENQRQILASFEQTFVGIAVVKRDQLTIQMANPLFCSLHGRTSEQLIGRPILKAIPELQGQGIDELLYKVIDTGEAFIATETAVNIIRNREPETIYVDFAYQPQRDIQGNITEVLIIVTDVTSRVLTESKLRSVIADAPASICLFTGRDFIIEHPNQAFLNTLGKGPDIEGKQLYEVMPELTAGDRSFLQVLEDTFITGKTYQISGAPVNHERYNNITLTPLFNAEAKVYAILHIATDVTEQIQDRLKLEETEEYLRRAMELAEIATWYIDAVTNEVFYSERIMKWYGVDPDSSSMTDIYPLVLESDRIRIEAAVVKAFEDGPDGLFDEEYTIFNQHTGKQFFVHAIARVICDQDGKPLRLTGTAKDITLQRQIELTLKQEIQEQTEELATTNEELQTTNEELIEANAQLIHSNNELAQYAYVASHDLQEPLRKIRVYSGLLESDESFTGNSRKAITKINKSAERMSLLIRDLLEFSRLLKAESVMRKVNLTEVAMAVINDFELTIAEKSAVIELEKLPVIEAVGLQMNQLFYNLLSNALKFSIQRGTPRINIKAVVMPFKEAARYITKPLSGCNYYLITFTDNGIGFETKYSEQIFDVFKRLHGNDIYPGSGIGLALCRRIVTNHQGHLYAVSEPGKGSTFKIIIPDKQNSSF